MCAHSVYVCELLDVCELCLLTLNANSVCSLCMCVTNPSSCVRVGSRVLI